ncbi:MULTISPECIES: restriction endonuclease subunit S [Acinetobacter]|uniref:Restriction endonuclease subunit S n=3 Tax=Acinetobacter TaxID=469 RepID=A0AAW5R7G7_ACIJU|nr:MULTISPECIES: restriction endonuclease subunit S [Acinetobacter]AWA48838.1 restriction endonuclease subunit S [Acinetobacter junii]MBA2957249.1 restriction endonuclease subunit S [Acinetobacter baumannii]MBA2973575.1 restriction endonuclease subunit S [Acinetobacter baumannii]MCJ8940471.1 restriction endonuclease subunit S [Acinetobacter baumannii]MCJ9007171.1 restriction endonuclease subunit S [Acinetobacter baumannii]
MSTVWNTYRIEDIADKITIGPFGSRMKSDAYVESGVPVIRGTNLTGSKKFSGDWVFISEQLAKQLENCCVSNGDLVFPHRGSIGEVGLVDNQFHQYMMSSSLMKLRCNPNIADSEFIYYFFKSHQGRYELLKNASQVGTPGIGQPLTSLKNIEIKLPSLGEQRKIAKILSDLDDKIHINNQINQTLESIAQALFKSWFVDFDPVRAKIAAKQEGKDAELAAMCAISGKSEIELQQMAEDDFAALRATAALFPDGLVESELGEVPKGWEVSTVGEQVQTVGGGTPSTKNVDFWDDGIHYWTTPKDLSNLTDKILLNTERKITDAGLKKISSGLLPKDTVLMSSRAPVGYLALSKIEVAINQGYIAILPNMKYSAEYLIQWCEANMAEIKGRASGTTFLEISKKNFREINFICSDEKVVTVYTKTAKTLYDEITSKAKENQSLINLRDTLLPKLMSGEISLNKNMGSIDD